MKIESTFQRWKVLSDNGKRFPDVGCNNEEIIRGDYQRIFMQFTLLST